MSGFHPLRSLAPTLDFLSYRQPDVKESPPLFLIVDPKRILKFTPDTQKGAPHRELRELKSLIRQPFRFQDLHRRFQHLALERSFALGRRHWRGEDLLCHGQPLDHMAEHGESLVAGACVERRDVGRQDEEVRLRCTRAQMSHGNRAGDML